MQRTQPEHRRQEKKKNKDEKSNGMPGGLKVSSFKRRNGDGTGQKEKDTTDPHQPEHPEHTWFDHKTCLFKN